MHTIARSPLRSSAVPFLVAISLVVSVAARTPAAQGADPAGPAPFSYDELVTLSEQPDPPAPLAARLATLLTTPFVSNRAWDEGVRPVKPNVPRLGRCLRVLFWNVERGLEFEAVRRALHGPDAFRPLLGEAGRSQKGLNRKRVLALVAAMREADLIVLNEVDWGLGRSGYRNVAGDLASSLRMNYAYGVEFVEVDPLTLGTETFAEAPEGDRVELVRNNQVDRSRYRGLHGTAILSRYRLDNVRLVPFEYQAYDWYGAERKGVAVIEQGKRQASEKVFLEKVLREVRRGGRTMLLADISDPDFPDGKVTVVATHLENRCKPSGRVRQLEELLALVRPIENAVVVAGDMNTTVSDGKPTSIKREVKKRLGSGAFWAKQGVKYVTGVGLAFDALVGGTKFFRTQGDPTVRHVPLVAPNPEAEFFETLERYRFGDGGAFDFRGDGRRSSNGRSGTLANSNERARKGFVPSFEVERTVGPAGKFKLDWFFVKPDALTDPKATDQAYRLAPHRGRTLADVNYSLEDRISDHNPILVDLPLAEPRRPRPRSRR